MQTPPQTERQPTSLPAGDWQELARSAGRSAESPRGPERSEFVVFRLAGDPYAVAIEKVREIVRLRPITPLPRVPDALRGVITLRGEVTQVVDLRMRLGLACEEPSRSTRIIVIQHEERTTALLVDAVEEVLSSTRDGLSPPPAGEGEAVAGLCVRGESFVSLLDLDRVLDLGTGR